MSVKTNLHGRLRNTPLPASQGLMPLFEAVVNSIHSIEESGKNARDGNITIEILRDPQARMELDDETSKRGPVAQNEIIGFKITDNGVGFNKINFQSFETLDSEHKIDKGCRGVGRLLWLKAFKRVGIISSFKQNDGLVKRIFSFDAQDGVSEPMDQNLINAEISTTIHLDSFNEEYRKAAPKTTYKIAESLLEHCLWYFVREDGVPAITLKDDEESLTLDDLYDEYMVASADIDTITIKEQTFELTHIKSRASAAKTHSLAYIAASRFVKEESIERKIPGLYGRLSDDNGEFLYTCYISSDFFDERVRPERTGLDIVENAEGLIADTEISYKDIREAVLGKVKNYLADYLDGNLQASKERVDTFVATKAPRYRPIMSRIPEENLNIDPNISDKDLDLTLHKHLYEIERQVLDEGHSIMVPKSSESPEEYQERLQKYLAATEDIKKSDLANYVSHRKVILDLLETAIQRNDDGKYVREELIHELIMPMRKDSTEVFLDSCNLWLLDERLAFHDYLASDKTLNAMPITDSTATKEPDICALDVCDTPILVTDGQSLPLASITVVEIKRPMRNDAKAGENHDPIEQALGYLNRVRDGKVKTAKGRPIPNSQDIPGYCYVICDLTDTVISRCKMLDLTPTSDHMGYFGFHKAFKAYIEVISFDRLVQAAKERNRAFFDKLGLPTT